MNYMEIKLNCEVNKDGEDFVYRDDTEVATISNDIENDNQVSIKVESFEFFINKNKLVSTLDLLEVELKER